METSLLKKGFWSNLILLSSLLIITLTFGYSKLPTNFKAAKSTLASISSDKADYQPGDTLRLSGTGFLPGETVTLHFDETPTVCPNGHNRSTVADSNGDIFYNQFYFNINHVGVAFVVTATGQSSGIIAQTTFTDANTALTSPSPTTAVYGSTITISSTLTQQGGNAGCSLCVGNGNPIPNRTLAFSVNGGTSLGSGVTNSSGAASSTAVIALNVGAYNGGNGLKVNFAGDSTPYAAQSATVNFSVTKATSSISAVSGSGIYGASATLTATVNLNIAGIPINFSLDGTSVGSANTNASGVATLVVPFASIPSSVRGANTWAGKVVAGIANTANYSATNAAGNLVISKLDVTGAFTASNKIYNGDNSATVLTRFLNGVLAVDTSNVSLSGGIASFADANVGAAKVVTLVGAGLTGSAAGNYNLTSVSTTTANIAARPITVTADAKSKIYGDSDPAFTYQLSETLIAGNAFSGSLSRISGENVGSYDITQGDLTLGSNYDLSYIGADLTIGQRTVEVTADAKSKTYGDSDPAFTYQITQGSLVFSDAFSGSLSRIAGENVGSYDIIQGDLTLGSNYDLSFVGADLTIGQRAVEVTADAKSKTYGASDPAFTYQITQGSLGFSDAFSGSLSRIAGENVGSYDITQGDLTLGSNYDLSYVGADLTIGQRAVEVTVDAKSKVFGDADPVLTYAITNGSLAFSDSFVGNLTRIAGEVIGSYAIQKGTLSLGGNYNLSYVGANLDIIGLPLTATVTKTDVTCNGLSNGSISITNPSGGLSGDYEYRLNSEAWQSSGSFSNLSANTYSVQIRDAAHPGFIVVLCTKVINEPALLSANCTNTNNTLYFGYTGDQTSTITVNPSGGVGPYRVSIAMNRPLMCNVITNSGDEIWTPGANTMASNNTNVTCVTSGAFGASQSPSSTSTNTIIASLGYSLNVSLMADATFAITVTDQNGCTATCSTTIMAEDVRCFAGNSGVTKVMLCHKTGSAKNPCVSICVDNTAVAEHLAHGDFFGKCTSTCAPSGSNGKPEVVFDVKAYPNPSNNQFTFEIESESTESTDITVFDIAGRMVKQMRNRESDTITFGEELPRGVYLAVIEQGSNRKTVRIIKE